MFGAPIVIYLFLGGTGAGLSICAALCVLLTPKHRIGTLLIPRKRLIFMAHQGTCELLVTAFTSSFLALAAGVVFLLADLGSIDKALYLFLMPHASFLTFGSYALVVLMLADALLAALVAFFTYVSLICVRLCALIAFVGGCCVAAYTGIMLAGLNAIPLWNSPWIIALFCVSAFSCGIALFILIVSLGRYREAYKQLHTVLLRCDFVCLILEFFCLAAFLYSALGSWYTEARTAALFLLSGTSGILFLGSCVLLGIIIPLLGDAVITRFDTRYNTVHWESFIVLALLVLVGAFSMRYGIVIAASHVFLGAGVAG